MSLRLEFVQLALHEGVNRRELCRRFGISPKTGYKWLARHAQERSASALADRSRLPLQSPARTPSPLEQQVVELRRANPAWGGRKISRRLRDLGHADAPAPSTVTDIPHRHGLIDPAASDAATPWTRFEHEHPNNLRQKDFKGWFDLRDGRRCSPLTVLDDHSRYNLALDACAGIDTRTVQQHLERTFRASSWDRIWGVRLDALDPDIGKPAKWRGQNFARQDADAGCERHSIRVVTSKTASRGSTQ